MRVRYTFTHALAHFQKDGERDRLDQQMHKQFCAILPSESLMQSNHTRCLIYRIQTAFVTQPIVGPRLLHNIENRSETETHTLGVCVYH